jgi:hypothetical protein
LLFNVHAFRLTLTFISGYPEIKVNNIQAADTGAAIACRFVILRLESRFLGTQTQSRHLWTRLELELGGSGLGLAWDMRGLVKTVLGDLGVISCLLDLHIFWSRATRPIACSDHYVFALFRNLVGNLSC